MSNTYHTTDRQLLRHIFWFRFRRRAVRLMKRVFTASLVLTVFAGLLWLLVHW